MRKIYLFLFLLSAFTRINAQTDGKIFTVDGNTYQVISASEFTICFLGTNKSGALELPDKVIYSDSQFTLTTIGGNSQYSCTNVTSVKIPNTVKTILDSSFRYANNLTSIEIPASVESIVHSWASSWKSAPRFIVDNNNPYFKADDDGTLYSKDGKELYMVPSSVTLDNGTYTVDPNVTNINVCAFLRNDNLEEIVLPPNLQSVEEGVYPSITVRLSNFQKFSFNPKGETPYWVEDGVLFRDKILIKYPDAKSGNTYTVPDEITEIASYGFDYSRNLTSIDLNNVESMNRACISYLPKLETVVFPKNLSEEGIDGAVVGCKAIKEYIVPGDCVNFMGEDGVVFSKDGSTLYFYPPAKEGATYDIPNSVTTIGQFAFRGQQFLTEIEIPANVTRLRSQAFAELPYLEKLTFEEPSKIQSFDGNTFYNCPKLTEVTLPSSLITLGSAFYQCSALEVINVPDGSKLKSIGSKAFASNTALKNFNFLGSCDLEVIGNNAFAGLEYFESFDFPASVKTIGRNAFSGCSSMASATFAEDAVIKTIGEGAFADCGLTEVVIPESVTTIENEAFLNCKVLEDVNLSKNIKNIAPGAFKYCENLYSITVEKENKYYSSIDGYLLTADKETLVIFPPGKANSNFTLLPPSITAIGDYSFYDCKKLENVVIPNKVKKIGKRAFGLCTNLNTITFLCDEMIDPANIEQGLNTTSFDYGQNNTTNMFENINTYVRKGLQEEYSANSYYQKFNVIGTSFTDNNNEYIPVSQNTVDLLSVGNSDYTFVVPETATGQVLVNPGDNVEKTYSVRLIGDYAFQNTSSNVHEVVVKSNVEYIGAKAFMTDIDNNASTIENVFFIQKTPTARMLSTTRFELDESGNNYNEFAANTNIYVKKSALDSYTQAWTKKVYDRTTHSYQPSPYNFTSQLDYKIPDVKIGTKYSTFAREFDTDFSDYFAEKGNTDVGAFVSKEKVKHVPGDYGVSEYHVKMTSVDLHGGYSGSYGYVPAYTGVLLKVLDQDQTASDFYYTIGEQDEQEYDVSDNIMTGVTVNHQRVEASETDPIYVIQKGVFKKATSTIENFPVHKAYMRLGEELPANAKLMFVFDDETTSIGDVEHSRNADIESFTYDLQGRRLSSFQVPKGIYIQNGRKFVVK